MPSPETDSAPPARKSTPWLAWAVLVFFVLLAILFYAISRPPSGPPIAPAPPVGTLYFLMVNESSEHTAALRGLYRAADGETKPALITEEQESQGMEDAPRQWISFPRVSPDGKYLAYLSTTYLITEESQTQSEALTLLPLAGGEKPRTLLDLTAKNMTARTGLAWTPRGDRIAFFNNGDLVQVNAATGKLQATLQEGPANAGEPSFAANGSFAYMAGAQLAVTSLANPLAVRYFPRVAAYALSPAGALAYVSNTQPHDVNVNGREYALAWAAPWYYHAHVTSLGWSPDGAYLGYTVTNPIVPEEGLYYLRLADGKCFRLPYATSRAGWTWSR